jgi:Zn-dependent M28 family amino/carboxypeptidase
MNRSKIALLLLAIFLGSGVYYIFLPSNSPKSDASTNSSSIVETPVFNADSSFSKVKAQLDFGPRVPGSKAHRQCKEWYIQQLKAYGWKVEVQEFKATSFEGKSLTGYNIMAQFQPEKAKRVLLAAHWDARPKADKDTVRTNEAIDAASDGASGPGVLLELARVLATSGQKPAIGVDILFFDLEDLGSTEDVTGNSWALGSQYWSKNIFPAGYKPFYGILLDMVGAKGATFLQEGSSMQYAQGIVQNVWNAAADLGYSNIFINEPGAGITDDHTSVNEIANIQMIDIVDLKNGNDVFPTYHHTHRDNLDIIDKNTLKAVGQTLLQVLYRE